MIPKHLTPFGLDAAITITDEMNRNYIPNYLHTYAFIPAPTYL